jgi:hypothetical protein
MEPCSHATDTADRDAASALDDRVRAALRATQGHAAGTPANRTSPPEPEPQIN